MGKHLFPIRQSWDAQDSQVSPYSGAVLRYVGTEPCTALVDQSGLLHAEVSRNTEASKSVRQHLLALLTG